METNQPKSKLVAGLLGIFLGSLGIHNFYLGYTQKAIIQLCCTVGSFLLGTILTITVILACVGIVLFFVPCGIGIWGLIEGIFILTGKINVDAKGTPLAD